MLFLNLLLIFVFIITFYLIYNSFSFQFYVHKNIIKKKYLEDLVVNVKGHYEKEAYFANYHKIISQKEYLHLTNKHKSNFSKCYNIVKFKSVDVEWELFYNLIKEEKGFKEVLNIRVFPKNIKIKSEGNVEKSYSRLNVFTNNSYLTHILETDGIDYLKWLLRYNGDILLISQNGIHFKAFNVSKKLSINRVMDIIKSLHGIRASIYRKDIIEY